MFEHKIVRITRFQEKRTREVLDKKNKPKTENYTHVESFEAFHERVENILNNLTSDRWNIIHISNNLPITGDYGWNACGGWGFSETDFAQAEFVFVLQREKLTNLTT